MQCLSRLNCVCKTWKNLARSENGIHHDFSFFSSLGSLPAKKFVSIFDKDISCSDTGLFRKLLSDGFSRDEISRILIDLLIASVDTVRLVLIRFFIFNFAFFHRPFIFNLSVACNSQQTQLYLCFITSPRIRIFKRSMNTKKNNNEREKTFNKWNEKFDNFPTSMKTDCGVLPKQQTMSSFRWWEEHWKKSFDSIRLRRLFREYSIPMLNLEILWFPEVRLAPPKSIWSFFYFQFSVFILNLSILICILIVFRLCCGIVNVHCRSMSRELSRPATLSARQMVERR